MTDSGAPRLAFLHEDPRHRGGGEAVLGRLSRLASAHGPVDLGLLFGDSGVRQAGDWPQFTRVGTFDYPQRLRWSGAAALARNHGALRRWLRAGDVRACVAMTFATAFRAALATAGTATPLAWLSTFSVRVQGLRKRVMRSAALRALAASGALAVCPSVAARDELGALGYPIDRTHVISNGVELERFAGPSLTPDERRHFHQRHGIPAGDLVALHVARLDPVKNHDVLLRAVALSARQGVRVALVCLGAASADHADYAGRLRQRAAVLGVADRVLFAGRRDDVPAWLAAADVAVLSSHTEMASLVLLEAAAARLPLLASRVGSAPEIVLPQRTGYLFDPGDADTCARHLITLASSAAHRRALGAEARRLAERSFDVRDMDRRWLALFATLLGRPPARSDEPLREAVA